MTRREIDSGDPIPALGRGADPGASTAARPTRRPSPARRQARRAGRAALALLIAGLPAGCQRASGPYPSREVKLIVQASPGGLSDTVSRVMASLMEDDLGVPVVCENKPGASGALAFSYVTRRPPDGYTIGHGPVEIAMVRSLGYADVGPGDMSLICLVSRVAPVLVVRQEARWDRFEDFAAEGRREPGALIMANSGVGSIWHFNTLLLEKHTGMRVTHIPYGGSSPGLVALLGGHVDAVIAGVSEVISHVEGGRLRPLLVFAEERSSVMPDVPTSYELGYPMAAPAWSGFYGPRGLPEPVRSRLESAFRVAARTQRWETLCRERGIEPLYLGREEFQAFAAQQAAFFAAEIPSLVRLAGAGP